MVKEWPTRPSDMKSILYFFICLGPYLALAIVLTVGVFLMRRWTGDTVFGIVAVGTSLAALLTTYLRYPAFVLRKSQQEPKIQWNGRTLKFRVKSGSTKEIGVTAGMQMELSYFSLRATSTTGSVRGLWLLLQDNKERVVFTGEGDFKIPTGQIVTSKPAPHTPYDQKVETFSQVLVELYESLDRVRKGGKEVL